MYGISHIQARQTLSVGRRLASIYGISHIKLVRRRSDALAGVDIRDLVYQPRQTPVRGATSCLDPVHKPVPRALGVGGLETMSYNGHRPGVLEWMNWFGKRTRGLPLSGSGVRDDSRPLR